MRNLAVVMAIIASLLIAVYFQQHGDQHVGEPSKTPPALSVQPSSEPLPSTWSTLGNQSIGDFNAAKKIARNIYRGMETTFYCGCAYQGRVVDHESCGYQPQTKSERAYRIEWEHVVPAYDFGRSFVAWRKGDRRCRTGQGKIYKGRSCARLVSEQFRRMEADLYNLVPEIGELNQQRSNYPMGLLPRTNAMFGRCETKIANRTIDPRPQVRGFVARTYKYMHATYPGRGIISQKNRKLFDAWDRTYPPTTLEIERARRIARVQGNTNPYVRANAG